MLNRIVLPEVGVAAPVAPPALLDRPAAHPMRAERDLLIDIVDEHIRCSSDALRLIQRTLEEWRS